MLLWLGAGVGKWETSSHAGLALAQSSGDVGGMVLAAVTLLVLGLAGVALWRADLSALLSRGQRGESAPGQPSEPTASESESDSQSSSIDRSAEATAAESEALTDREQVVSLLDDNDGRMKQARIVDETGWSKSKVSMLLSKMEDDEDISKLRVGRENIISLSGNEPEAAGSPFDDE